MECRKLDITVLSAKNLPNNRKYGRMKVYAEVSINGKSKTAKKTTVDKQNECNPVWNSTVTFAIAENIVQQVAGVDIVVKLFCERTTGNRYIGEVKLPMSSLFGKGSTSSQNIDYPVSGTADGILSISCKFGEKILVQKKPSSGWDVTTKIMVAVGLTILIKGTLILITGGLYDGDFEFGFNDPSDCVVDSVDGVSIDDPVIIDC